MAQQMNGKGPISMGVVPSSQPGTRTRKAEGGSFLSGLSFQSGCFSYAALGIRPTTQMVIWGCITGFPDPNS